MNIASRALLFPSGFTGMEEENSTHKVNVKAPPNTLNECDEADQAQMQELEDPMVVKKILSCAAGNVLEWFDFGLFGSLAADINAQFFPPGASSMGVFAVFAGAFLMRPVGGELTLLL